MSTYSPEQSHAYRKRFAIAPVLRSNLSRIALRSQLDVARMLGCSKQAIEQTEQKAIWKLRTRLQEVCGWEL